MSTTWHWEPTRALNIPGSIANQHTGRHKNVSLLQLRSPTVMILIICILIKVSAHYELCQQMPAFILFPLLCLSQSPNVFVEMLLNLLINCYILNKLIDLCHTNTIDCDLKLKHKNARYTKIANIDNLGKTQMTSGVFTRFLYTSKWICYLGLAVLY